MRRRFSLPDSIEGCDRLHFFVIPAPLSRVTIELLVAIAPHNFFFFICTIAMNKVGGRKRIFRIIIKKNVSAEYIGVVTSRWLLKESCLFFNKRFFFFAFFFTE